MSRFDFIKMIGVWVFSLGVIAQAGAAGLAMDPLGDSTVYKKVEGRELKLWIIKPEGWKASDRRPAVVFFHGGGWVGGPRGQFNEQSKYLASRGMVCIQVEYRLINGNRDKTPLVCCQDAKSAMRWVRSHANDLGVDAGKIASGGGSAGGHLAAFAGMVDGLDDPADDKSVSPKSNAMLLFNPVFNNGPKGYGYDRVKNRYKEFSPVHNVSSDDPPAIVFLGTRDDLIPVKTVENFKADMQKAGVRCEAFFYNDQAHGFFNNDPWRTKTLIEVDKFLSSLGWLTGPATLKE